MRLASERINKTTSSSSLGLQYSMMSSVNTVQKEKTRVYAIAFDMDTESLKQLYTNDSWNNAYTDIKRILQTYGFERQQGSVYFGKESVNAVTCVLAVQDLTKTLPWFAASVKDIRMLRIEEDNDLLPAVTQVKR